MLTSCKHSIYIVYCLAYIVSCLMAKFYMLYFLLESIDLKNNVADTC